MPGQTLIEGTGSAFTDGVAPKDVREQTERVCVDPLFSNSQCSRTLLGFIVDRTLTGQKDELKERTIGIEVFGRTPDYDSSNDSRVRVAANDLRKRLGRYYSKAEHARELRIDVPVGSYVAKFTLPEKLPVEAPQQEKKQQLFRRSYIRAAAAIVLGLAIWTVVRLLLPVPVIDRFWAPVVSGSEPVSIFIGRPADTNGVSQTPNSPAPEKAELPNSDSSPLVEVRMTDTTAAENLAAYLRHKGKDSVVRPTQGTELADMRTQSAVIYGRFLNEWAARLWSNPHFQFRESTNPDVRWIEDTSNPTNRSWSADMSAPDQVGRDYALITRVQDPTSGRWWIGIAGLTGPGTAAASQMMIDPSVMSIIGAGLPKGWEHKNLQIVIEIKLAQGRPGATRVISTYAW